jgi:hypothetical protein
VFLAAHVATRIDPVAMQPALFLAPAALLQDVMTPRSGTHKLHLRYTASIAGSRWATGTLPPIPASTTAAADVH